MALVGSGKGRILLNRPGPRKQNHRSACQPDPAAAALAPLISRPVETLPMRITLTALHPEMPDGPWVGFSCAVGNGRGQWSGPLPPLASEHEVELALEDGFQWDHNLHASPSSAPRMDWSADGLRINAQLLQVDSDGGAALAIGGSIVLLSLQGASQDDPQWVELRARKVALYPVIL